MSDKTTSNTLARSIAWVLRQNAVAAGMPALLVAAAATVAAPAAWAQATDTSASASETVLAEVVVTGSRIRRESLSDAPAPTLSVVAEEIEDRQFANAIEAISEMQLGSVITNRGANTQFGDNFAFVNLLNVGTQRTLTLLNGRRVVPSNQGTVFVPGNASGAQVDLSLINPLMIQRVEVVTGTGGAVYGADAVAGVVNIITRDNYEGLSVDLAGGRSEFSSDEHNYRVSAIWGQNFLDGRFNVTLSADYYSDELVPTSNRTAARYLGSGITNQLNGAGRDQTPFSAPSAALVLRNGGTLTPAFVPSGSDLRPSTFLGPLNITNPMISEGGVLMTGQFATASTNTPIIPAVPTGSGLGAAADPAGFAFFAPSALTTAQNANPVPIITALAPGVDPLSLTLTQQRTLALQLLQRNRPTPWEYYQQNPGLNPLLFVGLFNIGGTYPTVLNTDTTTNTLFPRVAVPLHFNASGDLMDFNIGTLKPPMQGRFGSTYGGDGYDSWAVGHQQLRSAVERASFMGQTRWDITDRITLRGEYLYTDVTFESIASAQVNSATGSTTAGTRSIPLFIDQNPFVSASALAKINDLAAKGLTVPTLGGQRVLYLGRALTDLTGGGSSSSNEVQTWRVAQALEGEFEALGRDFYWDVSAGYGEAEATNNSQQLLDIEFALAVDVVRDASGKTVCRQQTLAAPEPISVRNPQLATVNTLLSLTPTAAQVAACKPLNLLGNGNVSPEAIAYVSTNGGTTNKNDQVFYAGSIGADAYDLPAGPFALLAQVEYRKESIAFVPMAAAAVGAARNTTIRSNTGELEFVEYGIEARLPLFGGSFTYPLLRAMELEYALRRVERSQDTESTYYPDPGPSTQDDVFNIGLRWKPFDDLTLRGNKSRSVRSASLVELFSAPSSGFSNPAAGANPCTITAITQGADPTTRRANCITAVKMLGIAADDAAAATFLSGFVGTGGSRPAGATGNPFLVNEVGQSWSVGLTWEPSFIPKLAIGVDYIELDITNEIGLYSPASYIPNCFDSKAFPNSIVSGTPVCDLFTFGTPTGPGGQYQVPAVNPLTGSAVAGGAPVGSPATVQGPFETAYFQFPNFNLGKRQLSGVNFELRYDFALNRVFGERADAWGDIGIRSSVFYTDRLDLYANGVDRDTRLAGSPTAPEYQTRLDLSHRIGGFSHTVQWFWRDETVDTVLTPRSDWPEQSLTFINPSYSYFNYYASYGLTDKVKLRLTVNNLTDTDGPDGRQGDAYDLGIGREYVLGVNVKF